MIGVVVGGIVSSEVPLQSGFGRPAEPPESGKGRAGDDRDADFVDRRADRGITRIAARDESGGDLVEPLRLHGIDNHAANGFDVCEVRQDARNRRNGEGGVSPSSAGSHVPPRPLAPMLTARSLMRKS